MIQQQVTTSSPKCLDGNAGFGVVAQTSGMAPNVARDVGMLSGYSHLFPAGDAKNPVAFLHVIRRSGGTDRHVISRVADCGNDYSGRTNRIGHHWIVEQSDLSSLPCGPAAIASQSEVFCTIWNEKSQELPRGKQLPNPTTTSVVCRTWQQWFGDAGWGGVVAERIEKGDPISIIFEPGTNPLPLVAEALALLPPSLRWKTTFSTFFMKSQEPPGTVKVQVKCIVVGSDEMAFAKLTPNTLLIDLRNPSTEMPSGKYVEVARTGRVAQPELPRPSVVPPERSDVPTVDFSQFPDYEEEVTYDLAPPMAIHSARAVPPAPVRQGKKGKKGLFLVAVFLGVTICLTVLGIAAIVLYQNKIAKSVATAENKPAEEAPKDDADPKTATPPDAEDKAAAETDENSAADQRSPEEIAAEKAEREKKEAEAKAEPVPTTESKDKPEPAPTTEPEVKPEPAPTTEPEVKPEPAPTTEPEVKPAPKPVEEAKDPEIVKLQQQLDALPGVWEGIALRPAGSPDGENLTDAKFLEATKDRVTLTFVPYVNLEKTKVLEEPIVWESKAHEIVFKSGKKEILTISLTRDGLSYEWELEFLRNTDTNGRRELNRIFLSKLRIEIDGGKATKDIALWTPVKCTVSEFEELKTNEFFPFWKPEPQRPALQQPLLGKEFIIFSEEDNSPMLLDFNELVRGNDKFPVATPKKFQKFESSLSYAPVIPSIDGSEASCGIKRDSSNKEKNELRVTIGFAPQSLIPLLEQQNKIQSEIKKLQSGLNNKRFYGTRKLEDVKNELKAELSKLQVNEANKSRIEEIDKELKEIEDIQRINGQIKNLKDNYQEQEAAIKAEESKWKNVKVEDFSIYLLKSGTTAADVAKPANRLLLFMVATP